MDKVEKERERCASLVGYFCPIDEVWPYLTESLLMAVRDGDVTVCKKCDGLTGENEELRSFPKCGCDMNEKPVRQPMQPIIVDENGVARFKKNKMVADLMDRVAPAVENWMRKEVIDGRYTREDYTQLMQLVGYSVAGFGDLDLVDKDATARADAIVETMMRGKK